MFRGRHEFTLLELVMVVTLLAITSGMVVLLASGIGRQAEDKLVRSELATIRDACLRFKIDLGEPPRRIAELLQSPDPAQSGGGWWWRGSDPAETERLKKLFLFDPATGRGWRGPYLRAEFIATTRVEGGTTYVDGASEARVYVPVDDPGVSNDLGLDPTPRYEDDDPGGPGYLDSAAYGSYVAVDGVSCVDKDGTTAQPLPAHGRRGLAILLSDYETLPQRMIACPDGNSTWRFSHYQLAEKRHLESCHSARDELFVRFVRDPLADAPGDGTNVIAELGLGIKP